ncbi:hypothetical protein INT43_003105, partial [Umbelopsis isabellina]
MSDQSTLQPPDVSNTSPQGQKKRSRATAEQLAILEDTFAVNVSPNSKLRAQLSAKLNMSERSIQIWFQNRRAKVKHLQKKAEMQAQEDAIKSSTLYHRHSLTPGYYPRSAISNHRPSLPPRMTFPRSYSTDMVNPYPMQPDMTPSPYNVPGWTPAWAPETHHTPQSTIPAFSPGSNVHDHLSRTSTPTLATNEATAYRLGYMPDAASASNMPIAMSNPNHTMSTIDIQTEESTTVAQPTGIPSSLALSGQPFSVFSLTIGTWHRMKLHQADLLCSFRVPERSFGWHISDNGHCFKAEFSFDQVTSIKYTMCEDGVSAIIIFELSHSPMFYMDSTDMIGHSDGSSTGWIQCSDFTENTQASQCLQHSMKGVAQNLKAELQSILNVDKRLEGITQWVSNMPYVESVYQSPFPNMPGPSVSAPEYAWP